MFITSCCFFTNQQDSPLFHITLDFSSLMNSAIVDDSQAHTKLDLIAAILPAKLDALFEAVQKRIPDIASTVKSYKKKSILYSDKVKVFSLDGFDDITITKSLSDPESHIALLICLLDARFPKVSFKKKACKNFARMNVDRLETNNFKLFIFGLIDGYPLKVFHFCLRVDIAWCSQGRTNGNHIVCI